MMARRLSESCRKISGWRAIGKKFMMRSIAWLALFECSVARQRWPVSAKVIAASIVSQVAHLADEDHVGRLAQRVLAAPR